MTPKGKTSNSTVILIERKLVEEVSDRVHVAGGDHQGIIINKDVVKGKDEGKMGGIILLDQAKNFVILIFTRDQHLNFILKI